MDGSGYRGYSGYAWYRLRANVQDGQSRFALKMPEDVDDAYQQISNQPAITIAEAAQKFGQEDDITVVSVVRTMAAVLAAV